MIELDPIIRQVMRNCSISDAHHAGLYSICGLALRLRDLYKWEMGLDPWVEMDSSEIIEWIGEKEEKWEELAEEDFNDITIDGNRYDPYDAGHINDGLAPYGLFYGAGYVQSLKPSFFLARLEDKIEIGGYPVYILGRELARDLLTLPALSQDNQVILRKDAAKLFLWDQIFFIKKSGRYALRFALESFGLKEQDGDGLRDNLETIVTSEMMTYIYHELGGIQDKVFNPDLWREIVAAFPHTPVELLTRSVKDLLADTNGDGTFGYITRERKSAALAFYVAFLGGLKKELFPELIRAFEAFTRTCDWEIIEQAMTAGYHTAKKYAEEISRLYLEGKKREDLNWTENEIKRHLLEPLGLAQK